jgi:hypothetical protein
LFGLALGLVGAVPLVQSAQPGLTIVTRETSRSSVVETTEYVQPDRSRTELHITLAEPDAVAASADRQDHLSASIVRCDRQEIVVLNHNDRTYMTSPLETYHISLFRAFPSLLSRKPPAPKSPNLLIETTTVQTGERKNAFGYTARRVITTRRHVPLDSGGGPAHESEKIDGWYIDLETRPSCERSHGTSLFVASGEVVSLSGMARPAQVPVVTFKDIGAPERGYAIETTTTWKATGTIGDPVTNERTFSSHKVVTQLSSAPLDPALFEIPPGFRPAEGRLAALFAQWSMAWQALRGMVAAVFQ